MEEDWMPKKRCLNQIVDAPYVENERVLLFKPKLMKRA